MKRTLTQLELDQPIQEIINCIKAGEDVIIRKLGKFEIVIYQAPGTLPEHKGRIFKTKKLKFLPAQGLQEAYKKDLKLMAEKQFVEKLKESIKDRNFK